MNVHHQDQRFSAVMQTLLTHIKTADLTPSAKLFRSSVAGACGSVRQLVELNGLAAAVRGDLDHALEELQAATDKKSAHPAAASSSGSQTATASMFGVVPHQQQQQEASSKKKKAPPSGDSTARFRWCIVLEETRTPRRRFIKTSILSNNNSTFFQSSRDSEKKTASTAAAAAHDPFFAGQPDLGAARDWDGMLNSADSNPELTETINNSFAVVHFLVDAQSILRHDPALMKSVSPLLAFGLDGHVAALASEQQQQQDARNSDHPDEAGNDSLRSEDALRDAMSLLWKGRPSALLASSSAMAAKRNDAEFGDDDKSNDDTRPAAVEVSAATSRAVLHGDADSSCSSPKWLQVDCALLMKDGALLRHADLSVVMCPNGLLPRSSSIRFDAENYRQRNLDSILSMAPMMFRRGAAEDVVERDGGQQKQNKNELVLETRHQEQQQIQDVPPPRREPVIPINFVGSQSMSAVVGMISRVC